MKTVIKIYDVDPEVVARVDKFAKENGVSRSAYLKNMLESYSYLSAFNDYESRYREIVLKVLVALQEMTETLKKFMEGGDKN